MSFGTVKQRRLMYFHNLRNHAIVHIHLEGKCENNNYRLFRLLHIIFFEMTSALDNMVQVCVWPECGTAVLRNGGVARATFPLRVIYHLPVLEVYDSILLLYDIYGLGVVRHSPWCLLDICFPFHCCSWPGHAWSSFSGMPAAYQS